MTTGGSCCAHLAQMAPAHHGVEHLVCGRTTEKWSPRLIESSTLFVDARRSSKTPPPEKVTKVARNCTEKHSVDWRPKSAFDMMYFFCEARPNHAPKILGVPVVTRPKHEKLYAPGVQFSTPRACCTTLEASTPANVCTGPIPPQPEMRRAVLASTPKYSGAQSCRRSFARWILPIHRPETSN